MGLLNKFRSRKTNNFSTNQNNKSPTVPTLNDDALIIYFLAQERGDKSAFEQSVRLFDELTEASKNEDEVLLFLIEDIIYVSLYATFFEQIMSTISENPLLCRELVEGFHKTAEEREQLINLQTQDHLQFILEGGHCAGCNSCSNHADLLELLSPFLERDVDFFAKLYVGMQTIHTTLENFLYTFLPDNIEYAHMLSLDSIIAWRQEIISYVEKKLS